MNDDDDDDGNDVGHLPSTCPLVVLEDFAGWLLPSKVAYRHVDPNIEENEDDAEEELWFDLAYFYDELRTAGVENKGLWKFVQSFKSIVADSVPRGSVKIRPALPRPRVEFFCFYLFVCSAPIASVKLIDYGRPDVLHVHSCSTAALMMYFMLSPAVTRGCKRNEIVVAYLSKIAGIMTEQIIEDGGMYVQFPGAPTPIAFDANGTVENFLEVVGAIHKNIAASWRLQWASMLGDNSLKTSIDKASVTDVVLFAALAVRARRHHRAHVWSPKSMDALSKLQSCLSDLLAFSVRRFVYAMSECRDLSNQPVPCRPRARLELVLICCSFYDIVCFHRRSKDEHLIFILWLLWCFLLFPIFSINWLPCIRRKSREGDDDSKVQLSVDVRQVWSLLNEAKEKNLSLRILLRTRKSDRQGCASEVVCHAWTRKVVQMYMKRAEMCALLVRHWNLCADGSCHSARDTLISCIWCHESGTALFPFGQILKTGRETNRGKKSPLSV